MFPRLGIFLDHLTKKLIIWTDPYWWIAIGLLLFILSMIHFAPLTLEENNHKTKDHFFMVIRRIAVGIFVGLFFIYPLVLYILYGAIAEDTREIASQAFKDWAWDMLSSYWTLPVAGLLSGITLNMVWHRYCEPYLSNLGRSLRVNQHEDKLSDITVEAKELVSKNFNPETYFKNGYYFVGLDEDNKPIYISDDEFEETHSAYFGPTGTGKGVLAGMILTQAIRKGHCVFMLDPKDDDNLPYILQNEAKKANKSFVYLDLNDGGRGGWHPFKGGLIRDRRSRMIAAFGLEKGGTNADVYKSKERGIVDRLLKETDGSIKAMCDACEGHFDGDGLSSLRDGLKEWSNISTFVPNKKKEGHSIEKSLLNGAVVYVRGSTADGVVSAATKAYISELLQEAKRLKKDRTTHLTTFFDEVRFYISNEVVDGLATIRSAKVNMNLATQSISDLLNIQDATINGKALQQSFEINCRNKFLYAAGDDETAIWGETISGTTTKRVAMNEKVETNRWGGEKWEKTRAFTSVDVPFINRNTLLTLPPRVAILYRTGKVACKTFTCWVNTDKSFASWEKREVPKQQENIEASPVLTEPQE